MQTTRSARVPVIVDAVDAYINTSNTGNSLYNIGGGKDGNNNFADFIDDEQYPRELVLGIIGEETGSVGHALNNEICNDGLDGGVGLMQITRYIGALFTDEPKGKGSGLDIPSKYLDCKAPGYTSSTTKYYSNSIQGIYANIKDGFRHLQGKHGATLNWIGNQPSSVTHGGFTFNTQDLKQISTTRRYNGACGYLSRVSTSLDSLNTIFASGTVSPEREDDVAVLADKLRHVGINQLCLQLHSPGDLSVVDSNGDRTGVFNGVSTENIDLSIFDANSKTGFVLLPSSTYSYIVQGTDTGVYGLSIDQNNNSDTPTSVFTQNVQMVPNMVHKYTIDWTEVANNGNGVHIDVDKDGDGNYEYGFDTSPTLNDTIAPTSSISLSGTTGDNGWHKSDVVVTLSATDNATGAGIYQKYYSLNNGSTWSVYSSPFTISTEGTTQILYYSEDYVLNKESNKTLTIKIDKTNPEAEIYFDVATEQIEVVGIDNLTTPTVTQTGTYSYSIKDESGRELKVDLTGYIDFSPITNTYQFTGEIIGLQYNSDAPIIIPDNAISYSWQDAANPTLLQQNIHVEDQFDISATYDSVGNATYIVISTPSGQVNETLSGIVPIEITTLNGALGFDY